MQNGKLRFVSTPYPFNYGALPQTWENPNYTNIELDTRGDNDLMDAVEISGEPLSVGSVRQVKILGALALIDEGIENWNLIFDKKMKNSKSRKLFIEYLFILFMYYSKRTNW